ncbi:MAG: LacI family DNA-binding transcriptional regulator [Chthoniobacterales bacterium]|nr:LacI family DNA-binding transcriptional regulator [Chthoniobacterales bacterium]
MSKRVSLRDVARHCNVSAMTVSCVVRQVRCVKESTRKRVEAAIEELGYQIDPALRALAAYRSKSAAATVAKYKASLAFFDSEPSDFSRSMYQHCRQEARRRGYDLKYFEQPQTHEEQAKFSKLLWSQGIRGILFGPSQKEFVLEGFQFEHFAMVSLGAFQHSPAVDSVCADYFQGLYLAAQRCVERGHRNIALFLVSYLEARTGHRWLGAYHSFCHHYQMKPVFWIYKDKARPDNRMIRAWLKENRVDAVLTLAEFLPPAACPPKLRQVFLNDWHVASDAWCVSVPQPLIAREGIHLLDDYLIHMKYGIPEYPKQISITSTFHEGNTDSRFATT